jgi:hypothetical protein
VACLQAGRALLGASAPKTAALLNMAQATLAACAAAAVAELGSGGGGAAAAAAGEAEADAAWDVLLRQGADIPGGVLAEPDSGDGAATVVSVHTHSHSRAHALGVVSGAASVVSSGGGGGGSGGGGGALPPMGPVGEHADREAGLFTLAEMRAVDEWARCFGTVFVARMFATAIVRAAQAGAGGGGGGGAAAAADAGPRHERQLMVETPLPAPPLRLATLHVPSRVSSARQTGGAHRSAAAADSEAKA